MKVKKWSNFRVTYSLRSLRIEANFEVCSNIIFCLNFMTIQSSESLNHKLLFGLVVLLIEVKKLVNVVKFTFMDLKLKRRIK